MNLNQNVEKLDAPAIPLAGSWADLYQGQHGPLIDLSQAVPNYPPHPQLLSDLATEASDPRNCGYGDIEGEPELRRVYSRYVSQLYRARVTQSDVHITSGCNQAFFATLLAVTNPGSTVLMANPCYFNHKATAEIFGLNIGYVEGDAGNGFLPDISEFEKAIDSSVSAVALVTPNNPTGAIYPAALLEKVYALCEQRNVWLILDETYREFASRQSNETPHDLLARPNWQDHFIQLYSFSKTFSIPGHRIGAAVAGKEVISGIAKVMDNLQICAPRPAQRALAKQIEQLDSWVQGNNQMIAERAQAFQEAINQSPGWAIKSMGGYFAYVERPRLEMDSVSFVKHLASEYGVLPLPGHFFGDRQDQYLRMAFANADVETIGLLKNRLALLNH